MAKTRSAHLARTYIEGMSTYSPYRGQKLLYQRDYDPNPTISVDLITKLDIEVAIKALYVRGEISNQELLMLRYVALDGRLSRRDISSMIEKEFGFFVDQRTISRRLDSAYQKIAKELGWEYSDNKLFRMIAKRGCPKLEIPKRGYPYLLNSEEITKVIQIMERV